MKNKTSNILIALSIFILLVGSAPRQSTLATPPPHSIINLTPSWTTGIISDGVGSARLIVDELNQDSKVDIATCSNGYAYVLNTVTDGTYSTPWFSEYLNCLQIISGDRDTNGISELYVATYDGKVLIIDTGTYQTIDSFSLYSGLAANDIAVGEVDEDNIQEIVLVCPGGVLVYDAFTYNLEWEAGGYSGFELAIGNIDNDPINEILINSNPAHILNADEKTQEWEYSGGFGDDMALGDVDSDGQAEIAFVDGWGHASVLDGDTQTIKWQIDGSIGFGAVAVADVDANGDCEVVIGERSWGDVTGYHGIDGTPLWSITNPEDGVSGLAVGDTNNNGTNEIIWGSGLYTTGRDALIIGSWVNQLVEWQSDDLDGPLYIAANDVDIDGQGEFVLASRSTDNGHGGTIRVYDGQTHLIEWSTQVSYAPFDIYHLEIGQLDLDDALEIVIGGKYYPNTVLQSYDGISRSMEWQSPDLGDYAGPDEMPGEMILNDLDKDSVDEIIAGMSTQHLQIFHGASDIVEWDSGALNGVIKDLAVGDIDGNAIVDIGILTDQSVYVVEAGTWTQKLNRPLTGGKALTIAIPDLGSDGSLVLITSDGGMNGILQAWGGPEYSVKWQHSLGDTYINELTSADLDSDNYQELILMGGVETPWYVTNMLWIGSQNHPSFWEYKSDQNWGSVNSMAVSDIDSDGQSEFLFGSSALIQIDEINITPVYIENLPIIYKACLPLYFDDFSNPDSGWPIYDDGIILYEYNNGEYRILVRPEGSNAGAHSGIQASDYLLNVNVRNQTGVAGSYGLIFGLQNWSAFYSLEIFPDGYYGIYRYDPYPPYGATLSEGYSSAIYQGIATNHIKVDRNGSSIEAYANGQLLASVSDSTYTGNGYLGLIVFSYEQPRVDIRFDNFIVNPINCGGLHSSQESTDGGQISPGFQLFNFDMLTKYHDTKP